jgi:Lon protease-like protein
VSRESTSYDVGVKSRQTADSTLSALPVFPLTGMLLLPGTFMPLNIFEQRYRNLVSDALETDGLIGMIQPLVAAQDNFGPVGEMSETPEIYGVGCVGQITRWNRETDGRYLIVLEGMRRFQVRQELSLHRGYRRVRARLLSDRDEEERSDRVATETLLKAALEYCRCNRIQVDSDVLAALPGWRLANSLAAALPFRPEEQQALLEAPSSASRTTTLLQLFEMSGIVADGRSVSRPLATN